jgi:hypothetical protein
VLDAKCDTCVNAAHNGELKQVVGPALHVGAGIEKRRGLAASGKGGSKRWPVDARNRAESGVCSHNRSAGVSRTEERDGVLSGHEVGGDPNGRVLFTPQDGRRFIGHLDDVGRIDHLDAQTRPVAVHRQCLFDDVRVANERKPYSQMPRGRHSALDNRRRRMIAAHRINGDANHLNDL